MFDPDLRCLPKQERAGGRALLWSLFKSNGHALRELRSPEVQTGQKMRWLWVTVCEVDRRYEFVFV